MKAAGIPGLTVSQKSDDNIVRKRTMAPVIANKQREQGHIKIVSRVVSAVDASECGSVFFPAFALVLRLDDEDKAVIVKLRSRGCGFIATFQADEMALLP